MRNKIRKKQSGAAPMTRFILTGVCALLMLYLSVNATASVAAELRLYAGAGLRHPVDRLMEIFQKKTGHVVIVDYAGSGKLMTKITVSGTGDVFLPGSFIYIQQLDEQGKIVSWKPVVSHTPVIAVNRSKEGEIKSLHDLAKPGLRLALGDSQAMAFGKTAQTILQRAGIMEGVEANVVVYGATVKQLAMYVSQGVVDASIVGRADAFQFSESVAMIVIADKYYDEEIVPAAVLSATKNIDAATALQEYLASEEAVAVFESFGFLRLGQNKH